MEVGHQLATARISTQAGRSPADMLKEGQVFSGRTIKMLPGQMAELSAFGQKITARLEAPLQTGERYFFQVTSFKNGIQLKVISNHVPATQRFSDQAAVVLGKLQLPATKENLAYISLAIEAGKPISKESVQQAAGWLNHSGLKDGMEALRFMLQRQLPATENVFQALVSARSPESLTEKLTSFQQALAQSGSAPEAAAAIDRIMGGSFFSRPGSSFLPQDPNIKALLTQAISAGTSAEKAAAVQALVQLAGQPVSAETIHDFKKAVSLSLPLQHPGRQAMIQQTEQLTNQLLKGQFAENKQLASLFQLALTVAAAVPDQAEKRFAALLGVDVAFSEETPGGKTALAVIREAFRLLGIDHEAAIASRNEPVTQQNLKQELLRLMSETIPVPIKEAAEQLIGRLNAQHILSSESGPLQQLVMQVPVQFAEFKGDITIKWQGKKNKDGAIDADFCRVLFYVEMPNLKNTIIDMQVQNRIIQLTIVADTASSFLKQAGMHAAEQLKKSLEQHGYRLSGVQFKQPSEKDFSAKPPLARIMDEAGYLGVDIRI